MFRRRKVRNDYMRVSQEDLGDEKTPTPDTPSKLEMRIKQIGVPDMDAYRHPTGGIVESASQVDTSSLRNCCGSMRDNPKAARSMCFLGWSIAIFVIAISLAGGLFIERMVGGSHFNKAMGTHRMPLQFSHPTAPPATSLHCVPDGKAVDDLPEIGPAAYVRFSPEHSVWPSAEMEYVCESFRVIQFSFGQCGRVQHYQDLLSFAFVGSACTNASVWKFATNSAQINCDEFSGVFFNISSVSPAKYQVVCSAEGHAAVVASDRLVKGAFCADLFASVNYFNETRCITDTAVQRFWSVSGADTHNCTEPFDAWTAANTSYTLNQCEDFNNRQNF